MKPLILIYAVALNLGCGLAIAQFSYPTCSDLKNTDFKTTELFSARESFNQAIDEPVQMDLQGVKVNGKLDHVDIYFVERLGGVKFFDGATKQVSSMGKIPTYGQWDNGLMGLALDPNFEKNNWIYFWYSPNKLMGQNRLLRLSRITMTAGHKLDLASEKILIEILGSKSDKFHSGGPMTFDSYGDLWVTVGNNSPDLEPNYCNVMSTTDSTESGEWGPSNTANLRGSIFRIHPDSSVKGYRIPAGNFGEYWASQWDAQGKTALAAEYRNPAKVLPEVYVKGNRSNYSIAVHPTKHWLAWGEVNYSNTNDEFNIVTHPVFAGYPYFHQNNVKTCGNSSEMVDAPKNNSPFNNGVVDLPPAIPGAINNLVNVSITGPIYSFDPSLASDTKFPPHLNQSWINMGWSTNQIFITTLDTNKVTVLKTQEVGKNLFPSMDLRNPLQAKYGPEGALYILNYDGFYSTNDPSVYRIDYVGKCTVAVSTRKELLKTPNVDISLNVNTLNIRELGEHRIRIQNMTGKIVLEKTGFGPMEYSVTELFSKTGLNHGVYSISIKTERGSFSQALPIL